MMFPHWKESPEGERGWFQALADLARYLRGPEGCPWDREQTAQSFAAFTREEADELVAAFESDDSHLEEEFGDTLFNLLAVAAAAESEGRFTLENALRRAHDKMIRRHEHVFGESRAQTPEEAIARWNRIKQQEKKAP